APIDVDEPVQIVALVLAEATGKLFTVTVTLLEFTQPLELVSVTVYVVVDVGLAVGLDTVVPDNPVDGVHAYVLPPTALAPIDVDDPVQIVALVPAEATGKLLTVTVTLLAFTQPLELVSVTVYVVVEVGLAVGLEVVVPDKPVDGVHAYVLPPTALAPIDVDEPVQIVALEPADATGRLLTVTVTLFEFTQPLELVSVTVYVVVEVGLAVGLDTVVELNPVEGDHA